MFKKATRQQLKDHNTRLILRAIYEGGPLSRADLARATRLTRPTVSSLVSDLRAEGLIVETGRGPSAGGKPPRLLAVDPDARHVLCVDAGNQEFRAALINLRGAIVARRAAPAGHLTGKEAVQLIFDLVEQLLGAATAPLLGIGLGSPGLILPDSGTIRQAVNLDWYDLPIQQRLEACYDAPIYLANDSQAAALAEFTFGPPRTSPHLLLIKIGQGVGAGIVIDGGLFYGDGGGAGEIGQVVVQEYPNGHRETLEMRCGTRAMLATAQQTAVPSGAGPDLTWEAFFSGVTAGDERLGTVLDDAARYLGRAVAHLIAAYNIHHVVLSGRVTQFGDRYARGVYEAAYRRSFLPLVEETRISLSTLGTDIVLLGCAALIMKHELGII